MINYIQIMMIIKILYLKKYIKYKLIYPVKIHSIKDSKILLKKKLIMIKLNNNYNLNKNNSKKYIHYLFIILQLIDIKEQLKNNNN